jgi:hypothetical protein
MIEENTMIKNLSLLLPFLTVLVIGCDSTPSSDYVLELTETRTWSATGISQISAATKNGNISVSAVSVDSITAEITRHCTGEDSADAALYIDNIVVTDTVSGDQLTVEADMPDTSESRDYRADFDISAPESIYLDLTTVNGNLSANNMIGGAELLVTNGNIVGQNLRGSIEARSTNGNVSCDMVELGATESAILSTTNGEITLELPSNVSATFDASTTNGTITVTGFSSVNYTINEPNHKAGTIGSGDATILITITNGNVTMSAR